MDGRSMVSDLVWKAARRTPDVHLTSQWTISVDRAGNDDTHKYPSDCMCRVSSPQTETETDRQPVRS